MLGLICQIQAYPNLRDETESLVRNFMRDAHDNTNKHVELFVQFQLAYINTHHEDFMGYSSYVSASHCAMWKLTMQCC